MECDHLNKLSIPFQQQDQQEIWWKWQVVSEELFNNNMIIYMYMGRGR